MTGNLQMLMKFRDIQIAEDIGKKAALGWFDTEFTMYGCAYLLQEKMYYRISSEAADIYDFIETSVVKNSYPSNVMQLTKRSPVPSGMREVIAQEVKRELALTLKETFPKSFFAMMTKLAQDCTNNFAESILWAEAEKIEGTFDEERLRRFGELVNYARSCWRIDDKTYKTFWQWLTAERQNILDDFICKDIFEKTLYGFAYEDANKVKYMNNAQKAYIYEKAYQLEQQGYFVTPIISQTYWYNYTYRLPHVIQAFEQKLQQETDENYRQMIKTIKQGASDDEIAQFAESAKIVAKQFGSKPLETLKRYGYRTGLLRE